jgi:acetylglutamate kinase
MIRVVKVGGRAQGDPALPGLLASLAAEAETRLCIVHGGGDEVTAVQRRLGREPRFVGGRRFTAPEDVDVVRMVLSGTINKRLVSQLLEAGVPAVGISGEDGGLIPASLFENGALGAVGVPMRAETAVIDALLDRGFVPVISPLGRDVATGGGLNVNGDDAAAAIAMSLGADELFLVVDVPGVLDEHGEPLPFVDLDGAGALIQAGVAHDGMAAKLEAGRRALLGGARAVRIGDTAALRDKSLGTQLTYSPSAV